MSELHPLMVRIDNKLADELKRLKITKRKSLAVMAEEAFIDYLAKNGIEFTLDRDN